MARVRGIRTAGLSFNVRGVGWSNGSQPWHGISTTHDAEDFGEVERWGAEVLAVREVLRFVRLFFG